MTPTVNAETKDIRRALTYTLLARALAYPDDPDLLRSTAWTARAVLEESVATELAEAALHIHGELLEHAYIDAFTLGTSPDCPRFEAAYVVDDALFQTGGLADLAGFYRAFGVELAGSPMRLDDVSIELEFMGFLCRKQAYAREHLSQARVRAARKAQRSFARDHLWRWGPAFAQALAVQCPGDSFYGVAARALEAWLRAEAALLRLPTGHAPVGPKAGWQVRDAISHGPAIFHPDEIRVVDGR
jgi:TorA maturation chaperone TorD